MIKWIGNRLQELHFGSVIIGKASLVLNIIVLITTLSIKFGFKITGMLLIIVGITGLLFIWLIGFVCEITGIREAFMNSQFKNTDMVR
jgi:hypothetical protein